MLSWLRGGGGNEIKEFALRLAKQIEQRYPVSLDRDPAKRPSANRLTRIIEEACNKSVEFQQQKSLGWFGKASLGNHFRWALVEAGYSKEFVDFATEAIIVYVSRSAKPQAGTQP